MNQNILREKLRMKQTVYIYDEYEEACLMIVPLITDYDIFLKRKKGRMKKCSYNDVMISEMLINGKEIKQEAFNLF